MDAQRLRTLTTGRLHTCEADLVADLLSLGIDVQWPHLLPRAIRAVQPWLALHVTEPRFWDGKLDHTHTGDWPLPEMDQDALLDVLWRFASDPSPFSFCAEITG